MNLSLFFLRHPASSSIPLAVTKGQNTMDEPKNSGLPVAGYTGQSDAKVALVNENKVLEERVLRQLEAMKANPGCDPRMVAIAFTGIQEAFMWANRSVFQPTRVALPEDPAPTKAAA